MTCPVPAEVAEERIDHFPDQYRESPDLITLMRNWLAPLAAQSLEACTLLDYLDLDTAVGDQLTDAGKLLGWPRDHCAGQRRPVFGFACNDTDCPPSQPIVGFCDGAEWAFCSGPEYIEFSFTDDELYRRFLKARRWTIAREYSFKGVTNAIRDAFGPDAVILESNVGLVRIAPARALSGQEIAIAHLYEQVLPIPPGVRLEIWQSRGKVFGFGDGWGGFCDGYWTTKVTVN